MRLEHDTQNVFFTKVEIKDYNAMINGSKFFDQPVNQ